MTPRNGSSCLLALHPAGLKNQVLRLLGAFLWTSRRRELGKRLSPSPVRNRYHRSEAAPAVGQEPRQGLALARPRRWEQWESRTAEHELVVVAGLEQAPIRTRTDTAGWQCSEAFPG